MMILKIASVGVAIIAVVEGVVLMQRPPVQPGVVVTPRGPITHIEYEPTRNPILPRLDVAWELPKLQDKIKAEPAALPPPPQPPPQPTVIIREKPVERVVQVVKVIREKPEEKDICAKNGMRKVFTRGTRSWRCRR
jgi:hypothetical protein